MGEMGVGSGGSAGAPENMETGIVPGNLAINSLGRELRYILVFDD